MTTEENETEKAEVSGTTYRRMTDAEFSEAKEIYELGKAGLGEIADTYKISRQALSKRFRDAGAKKGSRAHELAAAVKAAATAAAVVVERFSDKRADWIEETRIEGVKVLQQIRLLSRKVISDAVKTSRPIGSTDDDLKAIGRFNKIICDNLQVSLSVLKADEHVDQDNLPKLLIEDLTNEEILRHHKNTGALSEDATIEEMLSENIDIGEIDV